MKKFLKLYGMSVALADGRPLVDATHAELNSLSLPCLCDAALPNTRVDCADGAPVELSDVGRRR